MADSGAKSYSSRSDLGSTAGWTSRTASRISLTSIQLRDDLGEPSTENMTRSWSKLGADASCGGEYRGCEW